MNKQVLFAIVSVLCGMLGSDAAMAEVQLPSEDGKVTWTVPLVPDLNVRICRDGGGSWTNIGGKERGARILNLVATVDDGRVVDLSGFDDRCARTIQGARPVGPFATSDTANWLVGLIEGSGPVSEDALGTLALIDHPTVPSDLERFARTHRSDEIRGNAVFLSVLRGGERALPLINEVLGNESSTEVRENAVFSLSEIDTPAAQERLREVARSDADAEIRAHAIFWVTESQGREALDLLRTVLQTARDEEIIEAAVFGISRIDGDDAAGTLVHLAKAHADPGVRQKAIFWLAERASEHIESVVDEMLMSEEDEDVMEAAVFAVARLPVDESIPILLRLATTHASPEVREQAVFWLGQKNDPRAVEALESIILD